MKVEFDGVHWDVEMNREGVSLLAAMASTIGELKERVEALESKRTRNVGPDDLGRRVLEFLAEHPSLKWTPGAIAENLDADTNAVGSRLRTFATKDMVNVHTKDKGRPTYSYLKPTLIG